MNDDKADELVVGVRTTTNPWVAPSSSSRAPEAAPSTESATQWSQSVAEVLGTAEAGDRFGTSVALGNFDDESTDDLAVGAPGDNDAGFDNAGAVNVLYGDGSGLTTAGY